MGATSTVDSAISASDCTTRVLVEQAGAVDPTRLGDRMGHLTAQEQWGIDLALAMVFDLT